MGESDQKKATPLQISILVGGILIAGYFVGDMIGLFVTADGSVSQQPVQQVVRVPPPTEVPVSEFKENNNLVVEIEDSPLNDLKVAVQVAKMSRDIAVYEAEVREANVRNGQDMAVAGAYTASAQEYSEANPYNASAGTTVTQISDAAKTSTATSEFKIATIAQLSKSIQMLNVGGKYYRVRQGMVIGDLRVVKSNTKEVVIKSSDGKTRTMIASFAAVVPEAVEMNIVQSDGGNEEESQYQDEPSELMAADDALE